MKKILLGTTTLIGAAGLFAGAALADTPKVTISGYENAEMGYVKDDLDNNPTAVHPNAVDERPQAFRNDTQIDFKIDGKTDAGLGYGGEVDLLADTSADVQGRGFNASKTFVYLDGMWGRAELGSNVGADGTMKVDAGTIARATGGIDGDWNYFANSAGRYLAMSELPLGYGYDSMLGDHTEENLNKITYYTPRFSGLQLGVSYLPDQTNRGQGGLSSSTLFSASVPNPEGPDRDTHNSGLAQNIVTGGVNYDNKFGDFGVNLAATGEYGKSQDYTTANLAAWNAGGKVSYFGWSLAGSYGSWGRSEELRDNGGTKETDYWTAGAAYEFGPFGASVTYMQSHMGDPLFYNASGTATTAIGTTNKFDDVSVGVDYKLAPGLTPYAEVTYYNENAPGRIDDNRGTVGIIGTQLNF